MATPLPPSSPSGSPRVWCSDDPTDAAAVEGVVGQVTKLAVASISACDFAEVVVMCGDGPRTLGGTDPRIGGLADLRRRIGRYPALDVWETREITRVHDTSATTRWPAFDESLVRLGIRSILAVPITVAGEVSGAINLHSLQEYAFTVEHESLAVQFANTIGIALTSAEAAAAVREAEQLRAALATRSVIEQAKGVLMAEQHCNAEEAFALLVERSQRENRKLRDVAGDVIDERGG